MPWTTPQKRPVGYVIKKAEDWDVIIDDLQYLKDVLDGVQTQVVRLGTALTVYPTGGVYIGSNPVDPGANNLVVRGALTIYKGRTARPYLLEADWPSAGTLSVISDGQVQIGAAPNTTILLMGNAYYDGTGFVRRDTTRPATILRVYDQYVQISSAPSGTGYLTETTLAQIFANGGVFIGSSPVDPGANNLRVRGEIFQGSAPYRLTSHPYGRQSLLQAQVVYVGTASGGSVNITFSPAFGVVYGITASPNAATYPYSPKVCIQSYSTTGATVFWQDHQSGYALYLHVIAFGGL